MFKRFMCSLFAVFTVLAVSIINDCIAKASISGIIVFTGVSVLSFGLWIILIISKD